MNVNGGRSTGNNNDQQRAKRARNNSDSSNGNINSALSPIRSVGNFVKCMPESLVDGVTRVSGGLRGIPNNMLGGVGRLLNVKLVRLAHAHTDTRTDTCTHRNTHTAMTTCTRATHKVAEFKSAKIISKLTLSKMLF